MLAAGLLLATLGTTTLIFAIKKYILFSRVRWYWDWDGIAERAALFLLLFFGSSTLPVIAIVTLALLIVSARWFFFLSRYNYPNFFARHELGVTLLKIQIRLMIGVELFISPILALTLGAIWASL